VPAGVGLRGHDLAPLLDVEGPRVRLGLAWAVVSTGAVVLGPGWAASVFAFSALPAARQAARSWRRSGSRPVRQVAVPGAAALPLAAVAGPLAFGVAAAAVGLAAVLAPRLSPLRVAPSATANSALTAAIPLLVGAAAAAPVIVRARLGPAVAVVLVVFAHVHDASAFIVGSAASKAWEGPVAGMASIGAVTLAVAAVLVPPFRGPSPWLLGGLAALLAPVGPLVATFLLGNRRAPAPALRRLDSLLVLGPVWAVAAVVVTAPGVA
jgi:hypothetical protein